MKIFLFHFFSCVSVIFILLFLSFFMMVKVEYGREKYSTFECGFDMLSKLRVPFSLHFYFVSVVFLVFDVEIVLLIPMIYVFKISNFFFFSFFFFFFFFVFVVGFFYEWYYGFLSWIF